MSTAEALQQEVTLTMPEVRDGEWKNIVIDRLLYIDLCRVLCLYLIFKIVVQRALEIQEEVSEKKKKNKSFRSTRNISFIYFI